MAEPTNPDEQIRKSLDDWADGVLTDRELIGKVQQAVNWQTPNDWIEISGGTGPVESTRGSGKIIGKPNPSEQIDAVMVLTDDEVAEIAARPIVLEMGLPRGERVLLTRTERDALCQTVRALREDLRQGELCEECEQWSNNEDGSPRTFMVCGACWNKLQETNTALREQLAQRDQRILELETEIDTKRGYL